MFVFGFNLGIRERIEEEDDVDGDPLVVELQLREDESDEDWDHRTSRNFGKKKT